MNGYYWEKLHVNHCWELKGQRVLQLRISAQPKVGGFYSLSSVCIVGSDLYGEGTVHVFKSVK